MAFRKCDENDAVILVFEIVLQVKNHPAYNIQTRNYIYLYHILVFIIYLDISFHKHKAMDKREGRSLLPLVKAKKKKKLGYHLCTVSIGQEGRSSIPQAMDKREGRFLFSLVSVRMLRKKKPHYIIFRHVIGILFMHSLHWARGKIASSLSTFARRRPKAHMPPTGLLRSLLHSLFTQ